MRVHQRHQQCVGSVGFRQVKIGSSFGQNLHRRQSAFTRSEQQRRQTTARADGHKIAIARPLLFFRPLGGFCVHIRTSFDEYLYNLGAIFSGGPHECGLSLPGFARIDRRAVLEQNANRFGIPRAGSRHQRGLALRGECICVNSGFQQKLDNLGVSIGAASDSGVIPNELAAVALAPALINSATAAA